jgi:hypothetical protein
MKMEDNENMAAKDIANLPHRERRELLVRKVDSPEFGGLLARVLELMRHEYLDVVDIQKMAARRQGRDMGPIPPPPTDQGPAEAAPTQSGMLLVELIDSFQNDENSPYRKLRHTTRRFYDRLLKRLKEECPDVRLADLNTEYIDQLYNFWTENRTKKHAMGHALITMVRGLVNYGTVTLGNSECERLSVVLHNMSFPMVKRRVKRMTAKLANSLRAAAHKLDMPSIALAQALQFDCKLSQKNTIGEWVPVAAETGDSAYELRGLKWLRGLRWEEVDKNLVLRHPSSASDTLIQINLRSAPMVMEELQRICGGTVTREKLPPEGAIVLRETGLPWEPAEFRRQWRKIARAAGIPDEVKNSDSRSSASDDDDDGDEAEIDRPAGAVLQPTGQVH